jgi:hypothetical protein
MIAQGRRKYVFGDNRTDPNTGRAQRYVYFGISESGHSIKVGISVRPEFRCAQLYCRLLFAFEGTHRDERTIHSLLGRQAVGENEWFHANPEVMEFIREVEESCA